MTNLHFLPNLNLFFFFSVSFSNLEAVIIKGCINCRFPASHNLINFLSFKDVCVSKKKLDFLKQVMRASEILSNLNLILSKLKFLHCFGLKLSKYFGTTWPNWVFVNDKKYENVYKFKVMKTFILFHLQPTRLRYKE